VNPRDILLALRSSTFSSTILKDCEITLPSGEVGFVDLTMSAKTVSGLWRACVDSVIAAYDIAAYDRRATIELEVSDGAAMPLEDAAPDREEQAG
jgi:hypothetical protein